MGYAAKAYLEKLVQTIKLKLRLDGGMALDQRDSQRSRGGKPRDFLVDDLVFDEPRSVVYCIACDECRWSGNSVYSSQTGWKAWRMECSKLS